MQHTAFQEIGRFVFCFQRAECLLTDLLVCMADADVEFVRILINELEYSKRVKTADVMFGRFVGLRGNLDEAIRHQFHDLMTELLRLGERRNEIVHSNYTPFINVDGAEGLRRVNSKLKASKGQRDIEEEDLLAESFGEDLNRLSEAIRNLESFRLKIIDWIDPIS